MSARLEPSQVQSIERYFEQFREFLKTDKEKGWDRERRDRVQLYETLLSKSSVDKLTEVELGQILQGLWANAGWTNKTYVANRVLESNDLSLIRSELKNLLWGGEPLEERYDRFRRTVKGLGPAGMTEIMAFVHPNECGLWNERTREALHILGLDKMLPLKKYKITGEEYVRFNQILQSIRRLMKEKDFGDPNLIDVDFFLYSILTTAPPEVTEEEPVEDYDFDHDEVADRLIEIGSGLGFEVESERLIAKGAKVDAIWTAKIANLGIINYVFEVQKGGSIDSLILNLQKARNNPTVQKLVVVANSRLIKEIREEVANLSEDFRKSLAFIEAKEILKAASLLQEFNIILSKLELVKPQF